MRSKSTNGANLSSPTTSGSGSSFVLVWCIRAMSVFHWIKEQWMLWSMITTIGFAYFLPLLTSSDTVTSICVALIFFLSGTSFPFEELKQQTFHNLHAIVLALLHAFLLSPLLIVFVYYMLPIFYSTTSSISSSDSSFLSSILITGLLCGFTLPPSSASALVNTSSAAGTESIPLCTSALGNLVSLFLSPFLMRLLIENTERKQHSRELRPFLEQFMLTVLLPFIAGQAIQYIVSMAFCENKESSGSSDGSTLADATAGLQPHIATAAAACSDICEANQSNWRSRVRGLLYGIMLFLSYTIFSSLFYYHGGGAIGGLKAQSNGAKDSAETLKSKVTWEGIGIVFAITFIGHFVLCISAWFTTGILSLSPEDRIGTFYSCVQKTEILAVPLLSQVFVNHDELAILLLPSMTYYMVQCCVGSCLAYNLRRWRNRQYCRPGTALLPMKYMRGVSKHQTALTPERGQYD